MRLTNRLLLGSAVVVSVLMAVVIALVDGRLYASAVDQVRQQLTREARLVAVQWGVGTDPDAVADAAGAALAHRVTRIADGGAVVGDSEFDGDALAALENHATRPEVIAARRDGVAWVRRRSPSAGDEELYVAVRAATGISRVSVGTRDVDVVFARARRDVLVAGAVAMVVALALAGLFSRAVTRPIAELRDVAQSLAAGDLSRRPALSAPAEVGDLAVAVRGLAEQLETRLAALNAEQSLTDAVTEALTEGVVAVDEHQRVVRVNGVARQLLRLRAPVPFSADLLPRDSALHEALLDALGGEPTPSAELHVDGRVLALTARPLAGGGAVLAVLDLTHLRRLEAVRRDFVANVSHELKTPLTVVAGFAETLAEDDLPHEQRRRFADAVRSNAARMQRIVDDLLDLSRIESGGWRPAPVVVPVRAAVNDASAAAQAAAAHKGVAVETCPAPDAEAVFADPTAVRQVVSNLVENAVRHTAPGGRVTIFTRRDTGGVWLGVRDTGHGIPAEHLPRIFERFYRADPGRARDAGGTGLGLAIVKHLVEAHGGTIRAESVVGSGTTIETCFPEPRSA